MSRMFKFSNKVRLFEVFAGIGTQHMALKRLQKEIGFELEIVGISEIDKFAIRSYNAIHGDTKNFGSITDIKGEDLPQIDLFTYSFPCQDISLAGKQEGFSKDDNTRSGLLWEVERILKELISVGRLPRVLVMENVKNLVSKKFINDFNEWKNELSNLGYSNYWQILNAKDYGIPQNRERVFMISILGNYTYDFPKPLELKLRLKDMLEDEVDEKYYLMEKLMKNISEVNKIINKEVSNTIRVGGRGSLGRHQWDLVADYTHNLRIRKLTPKECWRLMGILDEDFEKVLQAGLSNTQLYKQAGNAIVVDVLYYLFRQLF